MATSGVLRVVAIAVLLAAQLLGASQCAACERGDCPSREVCGCCADIGPEAVSPGCPSCAAVTRASHDAGAAAPCCPTDESVQEAADDAVSPPCRCQLQPRDERPIDRPHKSSRDGASSDGSVGLPGPAVPTVADAGLDHAVGRHPAIDVPRRAARILFGVWRN